MNERFKRKDYIKVDKMKDCVMVGAVLAATAIQREEIFVSMKYAERSKR